MTLRILLTVSLLSLVGCDSGPLEYPEDVSTAVEAQHHRHVLPECTLPLDVVSKYDVVGLSLDVQSCPGFASCVQCQAFTVDGEFRTTLSSCHLPGRTEMCAAHCSECF